LRFSSKVKLCEETVERREKIRDTGATNILDTKK
jgi:hypothetical protein